MKVSTVELSSDYKEIIILALGDLHEGDRLSDGSLLKDRLDFIKKTDNCFVFLNGDLIDNAQPDSPGKNSAWYGRPHEQMEYMADTLSPIKDKIIGAVDGNHEARTAKHGYDITAVMLGKIGVPLTRYSPDGLYTFLKFGQETRPDGKGGKRKIPYQIYQNHGTGGGRTAGGKLNPLYEMGSIVAADLYIRGHTHLPAGLPGIVLQPDLRNHTIIEKPVFFISTAANCKYGGYGETGGYKPLSNLTPYAYLCGTKKAIDIDYGVRRTF